MGCVYCNVRNVRWEHYVSCVCGVGVRAPSLPTTWHVTVCSAGHTHTLTMLQFGSV